MAIVVKQNGMLNARQVEEAITVPLDDGEELTLACAGDWILYNNEMEFKGIVEDKDLREKWIRVK